MNIINQSYRKTYNNPYRHGVLIGNFVEDIIGQDLNEKFQNEHNEPSRYISEMKDRYTEPVFKESHLRNPGNDLTMKCNSNFDLNIEFNKKNVEDYLKLQEDNGLVLQDKNNFVPEQIKSEQGLKRFNDTLNGTLGYKDINSETQRKLKDFHQQDTMGTLFTKKAGLVNNLYFGHGLNQKSFNQNEYASTYHLTIGKKEKTDRIYHPKYKVEDNFKFPSRQTFDRTDWGYRKYKKYDEFTKTFDKLTNVEK